VGEVEIARIRSGGSTNLSGVDGPRPKEEIAEDTAPLPEGRPERMSAP
jgi:hypothetical protein